VTLRCPAFIDAVDGMTAGGETRSSGEERVGKTFVEMKKRASHSTYRGEEYEMFSQRRFSNSEWRVVAPRKNLHTVLLLDKDMIYLMTISRNQAVSEHWDFTLC
jgi:hypothetical protein